MARGPSTFILLLKILLNTFLFLGSESLQRKDLEELGLGVGGQLVNGCGREKGRGGEKPFKDLINPSSEIWPRQFCISGEMLEYND